MAYAGPVAFPVIEGGTGDSSFTAYAPVCGGTTTTGALQSAGTGIGSAGTVLTSNGASALPSWQSGGAGAFITVAMQTFTSSGTYTPTAGMLYAVIECQAAGGAGGGTSASGAGAGAGGGGAGGYSRGVFSAATIGASQTVTIGTGGTGVANGNGNAGGNSSVGALITCNGGSGGKAPVAQATSPAGGAGGSASGGNVNITGGTGQPGLTQSTGIISSGAGANSLFGFGGAALLQYPDTNGNPGIGYGSGGSGGIGQSVTNRSGGAGAGGIVVITEYCT
jgi:hypothetical protein